MSLAGSISTVVRQDCCRRVEEGSRRVVDTGILDQMGCYHMSHRVRSVRLKVSDGAAVCVRIIDAICRDYAAESIIESCE